MAHVRLTQIVGSDARVADGLNTKIRAAADAAWGEGGSPRKQLEAARVAAGADKRLSYTPHAGAKQRAKAAKRLGG